MRGPVAAIFISPLDGPSGSAWLEMTPIGTFSLDHAFISLVRVKYEGNCHSHPLNLSLALIVSSTQGTILYCVQLLVLNRGCGKR